MFSADMLALESRLPQMTAHMEELLTWVVNRKRDHMSYHNQTNEADDLFAIAPKHHRQSLDLIGFYQQLCHHSRFNNLHAYRYQKLVLQKAQLVDSMMLQFPSSIRSTVLLDCAIDLSQAPSEDYLHRAMEYAKRALRMVLLMRGREDSTSHCYAHEVVLRVLKQQPLQAAPPNPNECAFCGERPESANITLRKGNDGVNCSEQCRRHLKLFRHASVNICQSASIGVKRAATYSDENMDGLECFLVGTEKKN
jgi:hypothetical protein